MCFAKNAFSWGNSHSEHADTPKTHKAWYNDLRRKPNMSQLGSQGNSCHLCHSSYPKSQLFFCSSVRERKICRKKFCFQCLSRKHPDLFNSDQQISNTWVCPSCLCLCECSTCRCCKHGAKRRQCRVTDCSHMSRSRALSVALSQNQPTQQELMGGAKHQHGVPSTNAAVCGVCGFNNGAPSKFCSQCGHKQINNMQEIPTEVILAPARIHQRIDSSCRAPVKQVYKHQRVQVAEAQSTCTPQPAGVPKVLDNSWNPRTPSISPTASYYRAVSFTPGVLFPRSDPQASTKHHAYSQDPNPYDLMEYSYEEVPRKEYPSYERSWIIMRPKAVRIAPGHGIAFKVVPTARFSPYARKAGVAP
eukprot:g10797.t1